MKKKFVGVSYESEAGLWKLIPLENSDNRFELSTWLDTKLVVSAQDLLDLHDLIAGTLEDVNGVKPSRWSAVKEEIPEQVTHTVMDMRFHPDPDGLLSL